MGWEGGHLMTSFQCDLCHFRNIKRCTPKLGFYCNETLPINIRRANLDALWAHEPSTVSKNRNQHEKAAQRLQYMKLDKKLLPKMDPFPIWDQQGRAEMCVILKRPLDKGENTTYVKFDTARKMCYCSLTRIQDVFIVQNTWKTYLMKAPTHTA